jgi:hypothetical protein
MFSTRFGAVVLYQQPTLCRILLVQRDTVIAYSCGGASVSSLWHLNSDGVQIEDVFVLVLDHGAR